MIKTTVKTFDRFPRVTARIDRVAKEAAQIGAEKARQVAQAGASIDLKLELRPAHDEAEGYSAGIKSHRQSNTEGKTTPIAGFFSDGTLGKRRRKLKRPRRSSWTVRESSRAAGHVAERGDVDGKGIAPERFFGKAKAAGRKAMLEHIDRELGRPGL